MYNITYIGYYNLLKELQKLESKKNEIELRKKEIYEIIKKSTLVEIGEMNNER